MDDLTGSRTALNDSDTALDVDQSRRRVPGARPLWRRSAVVVTGAAAAALAVGFGVWMLPANHPNGVPVAYASPPPPIDVVGGEPVDGTQALLDLAEVAAERGPASGEGEIGFVSSTGIILYRVTPNADVNAPSERGYGFVPFDWERWQSLDGEFRQISYPKPPIGGKAVDHIQFREQVSDSVEETPPEQVVLHRELPTDPEALEQALLDGKPQESLFRSITLLYEQRPLSGEEEAAVQRIIADRAGVRHLGIAIDPLEREGDLFSITVTEEHGKTSEYRFLYNEGGSLLYYDSSLVDEENPDTPIEEFGLEYPVLSSQVSFGWSGWVEELGDRP
jgi:hypothetical protein